MAPKIDNNDSIRDFEQTRLQMDVEEFEENEDSKDESETDSSDACDFMMSKTNNLCPKCRRYIPPRAFHCRICQQCIAKRDHHRFVE